MSKPPYIGIPVPQLASTEFHPDADYKLMKKDERNDNVSIEYLRLAVDAMKGRDASPKQIADCADMFWAWSQADTWTRDP